MKKILLFLVPMFLLVGCSKSGTWTPSSEAKSELTSSAESSESQPDPEPEQKPDNWKMVKENEFIAAIEKTQTLADPSYPSASLNGFYATYIFTDVLFNRQEDGKYTTDSTQSGLEIAKNVVDTKLVGFDYNHLGDGGSYCKPYLYVSDVGNTRVFVKDSETITEVSFNEYGYVINLTMAKETKDGPTLQLLFDWNK